jgi:hypothetical protein
MPAPLPIAVELAVKICDRYDVPYLGVVTDIIDARIRPLVDGYDKCIETLQQLKDAEGDATENGYACGASNAIFLAINEIADARDAALVQAGMAPPPREIAFGTKRI